MNLRLKEWALKILGQKKISSKVILTLILPRHQKPGWNKGLKYVKMHVKKFGQKNLVWKHFSSNKL